ncbi:MAG: hypothetical protein JXQ82_00365 [Methanomicrobiaceae archaeon]|nr:hypothetical protein [Methanomicrobiaceae archaeon]
MSEKIKNNPLRVIAALILGVVIGVIGFFIVALILGLIEDMSGFATGITANFSENIVSAVLLLIFVIAGAGFFYWKVSTTPPSKEPSDSE